MLSTRLPLVTWDTRVQAPWGQGLGAEQVLGKWWRKEWEGVRASSPQADICSGQKTAQA